MRSSTRDFHCKLPEINSTYEPTQFGSARLRQKTHSGGNLRVFLFCKKRPASFECGLTHIAVSVVAEREEGKFSDTRIVSAFGFVPPRQSRGRSGHSSCAPPAEKLELRRETRNMANIFIIGVAPEAACGFFRASARYWPSDPATTAGGSHSAISAGCGYCVRGEANHAIYLTLLRTPAGSAARIAFCGSYADCRHQGVA